MTVVLFCHSLRSDWNNGHVHLLRGVRTELQRRGHDVRVYEPEDAWSTTSLVCRHRVDELLRLVSTITRADAVSTRAS